jgi:hypothetical protein
VLRQQRQESTLNFSRSFSTVSKIFAVKQRNSAQRGANRFPETTSASNAAQAGENSRENPIVNYESPALTAELEARCRR